MATTPPVTPAPKISWLKKVGQVFAKIIHVIATDAAPIEKIAVPVAEALMPQFIPLINVADGIFSNIVKEAVAVETVSTAASAAQTGQQKLEAVLVNIGPVLDQWVSANFPGSAQVSAVQKAGLVNAVVAILNEIEGTPALPVA